MKTPRKRVSVGHPFFISPTKNSQKDNLPQDETKQATPVCHYARYVHPDFLLSAQLYYDFTYGLWVLTYLKSGEKLSSTLYQSEATAILLLKSLGYKLDKQKAC